MYGKTEVVGMTRATEDTSRKRGQMLRSTPLRRDECAAKRRSLAPPEQRHAKGGNVTVSLDPPPLGGTNVRQNRGRWHHQSNGIHGAAWEHDA